MLIFLLGDLVGAALAYTGLWMLNRWQTRVLLAENALLRARLRSLLVLAEQDLLRPQDPEIQALLGETRSNLLHEKERPFPEIEANPTSQDRTSGDDTEEDIPSIFTGRSS